MTGQYHRKHTLYWMFAQRMRRLGQHKEFLDRVKYIKEQDKLKLYEARRMAMYEFGFKDSATERKLYELYQSEKQKDVEEELRKLASTELPPTQVQIDYDAAFNLLPNTAPAMTEIEWVRSHPAMSRLDRTPDGSRVVLTVDDIICPPNGKAPSKSAVNSLAHWANDPGGFQKALIGTERKKAADSEADKPIVVDSGVEEIQRYLEQLEQLE